MLADTISAYVFLLWRQSDMLRNKLETAGLQLLELPLREHMDIWA